MAFTSEIRGFEAGMLTRMHNGFRTMASAYEKRRQFEYTVRELSALDRRELDDLGLTRDGIREAAYRAVYGR